MASTLEARRVDGDQHDGRPADVQSKAPDGLEILDARNRADRVAERLRKSERAIGQILRARDEQIGIQRGVQPVHDRVVAFAADAAEPDDLPERQHERRDGAGRAPWRLNQAVRGERALDRPQPLQHRPQRSREPERNGRHQQQRRKNDRACTRRRTRRRCQSTASPARRPSGRPRSGGARDSRRRSAPDTSPSAAPEPDRRATRFARAATRQSCWCMMPIAMAAPSSRGSADTSSARSATP